MKRRTDRAHEAIALVLAAALLLLPVMPLGCGGDDTPVILAATVDLEGSGILQEWIEGFESSSGRSVELLVVPDEQAFAMARHGECDLILTHIPEEGVLLERSGYIEGGAAVMIGDFVVTGPPEDPAAIRGMEITADAFAKIANSDQLFILRIDGSGTAYKQLQIWSISGVGETGEWLLPTDEGLEGALRQASQEGAYTLSDRTTYERLAGELDLEILVQGDVTLIDYYDVAAVSVLPYPDTNLEGAQEFIAYLLSDDARSALGLGAWQPPPAE